MSEERNDPYDGYYAPWPTMPAGTACRPIRGPAQLPLGLGLRRNKRIRLETLNNCSKFPDS